MDRKAVIGLMSQEIEKLTTSQVGGFNTKRAFS